MSDMDLGKVSQSKYYEFSSGAAEGTIGFGKAVVRGTNPETQYTVYPGDSEDVSISGFAAFTLSGNIDDLEFEDKQPMRVLNQGVIAVKVSEDADTSPAAGDKVAVSPDGDVFTATEANDDSGSGGTYAAILSNSEFAEGADAGDTVLIEVNFPTDVEFVEQA